MAKLTAALTEQLRLALRASRTNPDLALGRAGLAEEMRKLPAEELHETLVQEALSQLRLDMKYLVFDLEATRRERDAYRSKPGDDGQVQ